MKNRIIILSLCASCLLAIVAFVYNSETKTDPLALSPIVAKRVTTPTGTLVSCNLKALKDTVDIPLSYLTEELQVVKLDSLQTFYPRRQIHHHYRCLRTRAQRIWKHIRRPVGRSPQPYLHTALAE